MKFNKIVAPVQLWKRVTAFLIDYVLIGIIIVYPFKDFFTKFENYSILNSGKDIFLATFIIIVLTLLYWISLEYILKQSAGKAFFNIYVRSKDREELKLWQCFVRNLTKVSLIILFLDSLQVIFRKDYQRYFEKISNTEVIDGEI